jgi:hypothetical protein
MSRDSVMLATPAIARRLLLLQRHANLVLPPQIHELASQQRIDPEQFDPLVCPHTRERETVIQFLLDCEMRATVQANYHPDIDPTTILHAANLFSPKMVSVVSKTTTLWRQAARTLFIDDFDVCAANYVTGEWIDKRRCGALIIDVGSDPRRLPSSALLREFPHCVLYQPLVAADQIFDWRVLSFRLFPTMPNPFVFSSVKADAKDLALYYNTCIFPELF